LLLGLSAQLAWYCGVCGHERTAPSFAPGGGQVVSAQATCPGRALLAPKAGILLLWLLAQLAWYCGACGPGWCGKMSSPTAPTAHGGPGSLAPGGEQAWFHEARDAPQAQSDVGSDSASLT